MCKSSDIGLDCLYCGKCDLDLDRTMPIVKVDSPIYWVIMYTDGQTHTHT